MTDYKKQFSNHGSGAEIIQLAVARAGNQDTEPDSNVDDVDSEAEIEADNAVLAEMARRDRAALPDWMQPYFESRTRESALAAEPDEEVFEVSWTLPEVHIAVLARRGEDWRPRLQAVLCAELLQLADEYAEDDALDDFDATFATIEACAPDDPCA